MKSPINVNSSAYFRYVHYDVVAIAIVVVVVVVSLARVSDRSSCARAGFNTE